MTYLPIASAFPYIRDLGVFKTCVGDKEEIRHMLQSNGCTVSSYIISSESTFDNPYAIECRGLVFNAAGALVARPLHKFFNLNERNGARPEDFDWSKLARIMDKRDGSMIHTVKVHPRESPFTDPFIRSGAPIDQEIMTWGYPINTFTLKSKKSFESDVAVAARAWMASRSNFLRLCQDVTDLDCTAIFEWTSPTARIVLPYAEDGLTLLHVRDNATGAYWSIGRLLAVADELGVPVVDAYSNPLSSGRELIDELFAKMLKGDRDPKQVLSAVLELQATVEQVEGWVFQFEDGQMVKVKTKWYMERHRAMTFLRERDIVGMVLSESIDDLLAMLVGEGVDVSEIRQLENRTVADIREIEVAVSTYHYAVTAAGMTKKDAALLYGPKGDNFKFFGLLMNKMDGKEPDVKGWYERNVLPTIPLRQLNLLNTVAEAE